MRAEFYIAQVLRWNRELRGIITAALGHQASDDETYSILNSLRNEFSRATFASSLNCDPEKICECLRGRLAHHLGVPGTRASVSLDPTDVSLFVDDRFLGVIAGVLDCPCNWPVIASKLFDYSRLSKLLYRARIANPTEDTPLEKLFWRLMSPDGQQHIFDFLGGQADIWTILSSLLDQESSRLLCETLGCSTDGVFAAILERSRLEDESEEHVALEEKDYEFSNDGQENLDMLGVGKFRELFHAFSEIYFDKAREVGEKLRDDAVRDEQVKMLLTVLDFDYKGAYRRAFQEIPPPQQTIVNMINEAKVEFLSVQEYDPRIKLRVSTKEAEDGTHTLIQFCIPSKQRWEDLLRFGRMEEKPRRHLNKYLPNLAEELTGSGKRLADRVLHSNLPALETAEGTAWSAMLQRDDSLVRYFVLSRGRIPDRYGLREVLEFSDKTPSLTESCRTVCPTPDELHDSVKREFRRS